MPHVLGGFFICSAMLVRLGHESDEALLSYHDHVLGDVWPFSCEGFPVFDRSLIIAVSDHGISFRPRGNRRNLEEVNCRAILNVPLLIKAPYQKQGQVSDRPTRTIEILPSIVDILGMSSPWPTDGISVWEPAVTGNRDLNQIRAFAVVQTGGEEVVLRSPLHNQGAIN